VGGSLGHDEEGSPGPLCTVDPGGSFPIDRQGFASTGLTAGPGLREGMPQGSVLAPLLFLFVIDDLQDRLPERGVGLSLYLLKVAAAQMIPQQGSSQMR
jgi:hypothetical protein